MQSDEAARLTIKAEASAWSFYLTDYIPLWETMLYTARLKGDCAKGYLKNRTIDIYLSKSIHFLMQYYLNKELDLLNLQLRTGLDFNKIVFQF